MAAVDRHRRLGGGTEVTDTPGSSSLTETTKGRGRGRAVSLPLAYDPVGDPVLAKILRRRGSQGLSPEELTYVASAIADAIARLRVGKASSAFGEHAPTTISIQAGQRGGIEFSLNRGRIGVRLPARGYAPNIQVPVDFFANTLSIDSKTQFRITLTELEIVATLLRESSKSEILIESGKEKSNTSSKGVARGSTLAATWSQLQTAVGHPGTVERGHLVGIAAIVSAVFVELERSGRLESVDFSKPVVLTPTVDRPFASVAFRGRRSLETIPIGSVDPVPAKVSTARQTIHVRGRELRVEVVGNQIFVSDVGASIGAEALNKNQTAVVSRPRPDRPSWANENRPTKQILLRLEPAFVDAVDNAAAERKLTRTDLVKEALVAYLKLEK